MMMWAFFGFWFWTMALAFWLLVVGVPVGRILQRTGYNPWLAVFSVIPGWNIVMLWIFAFSPWPADRK